MNRKEFLKNSMRAGLCGCGALVSWVSGPAAVLDKETTLSSPGILSVLDGRPLAGQRLSDDLGRRMREGSKSPDWVKLEKAKSWIKSMLDNIDDILDDGTRIKLLNACGRACYNHALGVADARKPTFEEAEAYLGRLEKTGFRIERGPESMKIFTGWHGKQNPWGLSLKEGYCLCPVVEEDVPGLSPTYCNWSRIYQRDHRAGNRPHRDIRGSAGVSQDGRQGLPLQGGSAQLLDPASDACEGNGFHRSDGGSLVNRTHSRSGRGS